MGKKPRAKTTPHPQKQAFAARDSLPAVDDKRPVWRFSKLDWEGPFSCRPLDAEKLEEVVKKLAGFETMTWLEIESAQKHKSHFIAVADLAKPAQQRLEAIKQADIDQLFSLRLTGPERVFGIRDRWILYLLWWDPDHQVCPSEKKHT